MIAKVTAPPFSTLNDTQRLVVRALRGKSKTTHELAEELKRNYSVANRAIKDLKLKDWVEVDPLLSGGRSNAWRLKQIPTDAIELIVETDLDQMSVSFNKYFEALAKQLNGGRKPRLTQALEAYYQAVAKLGYFAAVEFVEPGKVNEAQLLEQRSVVQSFVKQLEDSYSIAQQLLSDERVWHADTLTEGTMRKTDRYLTPADMARYAQMINAAFTKSDSEEDDNENEEMDSADD